MTRIMLDRVRSDPFFKSLKTAIVLAYAVAGLLPAGMGKSPGVEVPVPVARQEIIEYETAPSSFVAGAAEIWDVAVSPCARLLATASASGIVRLYDRASRELLQLSVCHADSVSSVSFSPDGTSLGTAGYDHVVKIWRVPEMRLERTLKGHTARVVCVVFSPDGKRIASCGYDGSIQVWNSLTGELVAAVAGNRATVRCIAYSPDGSLLASGGDDGLVNLWHAATLELRARLEGHTARVRAVAFAPHENLLASVAEDGAARVWDLGKREAVHVIQRGEQGWRLAFSSSGNTLAAGYRDGSIRLYDVATGEFRAERESHSDVVSSLAFLHDDQTFYSGSYDGTVLAWNARMPAQPTVARVATDEKVWAVAVSSQGDLLAAAGRDGFVQLRDMRNGRPVRELAGHPATVDCVAFSANGDLLAAAGWRSTEVMVWQTVDGTSRHRFKAPSNVRAVAFSPDVRHLAAACEDNQLVVWDLADSERVVTVLAHQLHVYDVAYSPDGRTVITCSGDWTKPLPGTVKLWEADSLTELAKLEGHAAAVRAAVFSPHGDRVASASADGTVRIWDVATHRELAMLRNAAGVRAITYSSDGRLIAAALHDGTINVWDSDKETVVCRLRGDDDMFSVRFAGGDSVICGAGGQRRVLFWDLSQHSAGSTPHWVRDWSENN